MAKQGLTVIVALTAMFYAFTSEAWMDRWAPKLDCELAELTVLPADRVKAFLINRFEGYSFSASYSEGGEIDFNGDGIKDYAFFVPWMGNGMNAIGYYCHFIVSDGKGGRVHNKLDGYDSCLKDIVKVKGKIYFRHTFFFNDFEKSNHNHLVYQFYSFGKDGVLRHANQEIGSQLPAVTIFYSNPRFKQIELTPADCKMILDRTMPISNKYNP